MRDGHLRITPRLTFFHEAATAGSSSSSSSGGGGSGGGGGKKQRLKELEEEKGLQHFFATANWFQFLQLPIVAPLCEEPQPKKVT